MPTYIKDVKIVEKLCSRGWSQAYKTGSMKHQTDNMKHKVRNIKLKLVT